MYMYVCICIILLCNTINHVCILSMRHSTPVLRLDHIPGGGVVGVGFGTKTDSGMEDVTTASEDEITIEDVTDDIMMLDNPTSDGPE